MIDMQESKSRAKECGGSSPLLGKNIDDSSTVITPTIDMNFIV